MYDVTCPLVPAILTVCLKCFDATGSGALTIQDISLVHSKLGEPLTDEEAAQAMAILDPARTGMVTFRQFRSFCSCCFLSVYSEVTFSENGGRINIRILTMRTTTGKGSNCSEPSWKTQAGLILPRSRRNRLGSRDPGASG